MLREELLYGRQHVMDNQPSSRHSQTTTPWSTGREVHSEVHLSLKHRDGANEAVVVMLLALRADVWQRIHEVGSTPLMVATENGHVKVVRSLLQHHADPMMEDAHGRTTLTYLAHNIRSLPPGPSLDRVRAGILWDLILGQARRQGVDEGKLEEVLAVDYLGEALSSDSDHQE